MRNEQRCIRNQVKKQDFENRHCHHEHKYLRDDFDSKTSPTKKRRKWVKERCKKPNHRKKFYQKFQTSVEEVDDRPFTYNRSSFEKGYLKALDEASDYYHEVVQHCYAYNHNPLDFSGDCYPDKTYNKGEKVNFWYYWEQEYEIPIIYLLYPCPFIEFRLDSIYNFSFKSMIDYPRSSKLILEKTYYEDLNYRMKKFFLTLPSSILLTVGGSYNEWNMYELFKSYRRFICARCLLNKTYSIDYDVIQRIASYV